MFITGVVPHLIGLLVFLAPVISVRGSEVRGFLGQSVTLPCRYSVRKNGETEMCWGRGHCSLLDCSQPLIRTNGKTVTEAISTKYHLDGKIEEGDVSLTVGNLREEDSGLYCCRVEITGLFNDQKDLFNLLILEGNSTQTPSPSSVSLTTGHGNHFTSNATEGQIYISK
ncbi:hepatitis A virus cellular receptor 1 homolog [Carcharodon carcharias]|uniref:hepatitis A virus cellular receptor 1 homolog n=1 Tax=Carcharodon carcharias TaxID=13397 RepID=UPI001B7F774E|nr:hepatitis A virus cellular receptor 1 homolog [Carcharodon carcharias]